MKQTLSITQLRKEKDLAKLKLIRIKNNSHNTSTLTELFIAQIDVYTTSAAYIAACLPLAKGLEKEQIRKTLNDQIKLLRTLQSIGGGKLNYK